MGNGLPPRQKLIIEDEEAPAADTSENPPPIPIQNPSDMSKVGKVDDGDNMSETFLHKLIADVDACVAKIAETEDGIQEAAKTFAEQLDESVRIKNGDLNVEMIRQTCSTLNDASAKLLKIIEDGHERKMCAMRQTNDTLLNSTERLLKSESDVCCVLKLDCYLRKVVGQTEGFIQKSLGERVEGVNDTDLKNKFKKLECKVFDLEQQKADVRSSEEAIEFQKKTQGFEQNRFEETQTHIRGQSTTNRAVHTLNIGDEPKQLTVAVTNTDQQTEELKKELDIAQTQVDKPMLDKTNLMGDIQEKTMGFEANSQVFEERANEAEKEIKSLVELNKMLKHEIDVLKLELQTIKSTKVIKIQIYSQKQNSLMRDIENELTALIKNRMSAQNTVVEFVRDKKDARKLNVGMTRELNVTFCERSAELLGAIEDGQEKKTIEMRQINGRLLRLAELRSKPKHVDMSACKLDSYLQKQYEQKRDKEYKSLNDRVISMIGEASCMKVDQGLNVSKSGQIEAELISENSSRELQHETTEFKQELQLVHSFEPTTFKERRSLSISTEVEQSQTGVQTNRLHLVDVGTEFGQDNQLTYELKEKVAMLKCELDIARKQVNDIKMENDALTREMQETRIGLENVNRMAQERAKKDVEKIKSLAEQVEILKKEFNTLRLENTNITTDMQEQITDIKKEKQELQERIIEAEEKVNTMVRLNDAHELEVQEKKSKKLMQVQIYSQQQNKWMANIEDGLTALLKSRMQEKNMEIEFVRCWNTSQIKPDGMLLTTCIHPSILGTDASNALSGVHVSPKVVLLVFHHKDEHALPIQTSDRILTEPSFRELSGILDIAFLSGKGIYDCNMNENSISQVMNFIERNIEGQ